MRVLPPVVAPILNEFAEFAVIVHKSYETAALPLSYVGADSLMTLACPESERDGPRKPLLFPSECAGGAFLTISKDLLSGHATVRRRRETVMAIAVTSAEFHT